jgi:two-component system, NarL family, invasion response regulator UvrY
MIRIMIADDHVIIRDRIKQILGEESDLEVICEAVNGKEVIEFARNKEMDIILLDFYLPDLNALQVVPKIRKTNKDVPILILTSLSEEVFRRKTIEAGASGFVSKDEASDILVKTIRQFVAT